MRVNQPFDGGKSARIGMVAHDQMKPILATWACEHADILVRNTIVATGSTSKYLSSVIPELQITALRSGPLGGDQQLGGMIAEGHLDALFFFQDPMTPQPHDVDVKALVRLSTLYDIPFASNPATAELLITNPQFGLRRDSESSIKLEQRFRNYLQRAVPTADLY